MLHGVDVASFQGEPNQWHTNAPGAQWAAVKVTEFEPGGSKYADPDAGDDWAWLKANGKGRIAYLYGGEWTDILKAAKLPHHKVHAMRHSAATIMLDKGIALAVVEEMMGHSDVRVTRLYTHVSSPLMTDAARQMGGLLRRSEP